MTLAALFAERAERDPHATALVRPDGTRVAFHELAARAASMARDLREAGIGPGDRVLVAIPVSSALYACLAAAWSLGATVVFPEPTLGLRGLRHAASATRPNAWVARYGVRAVGALFPETRAIPVAYSPVGDHDRRARLAPGPDTPDAPALVSFTSGTTGEPKCIVRTHGFLLRQTECLEPLLRPEGHEAYLTAFPVFVLVNLAMGVTTVLPNWDVRRPDALDVGELLKHVDRFRVTRMLVQPAVCERLVGEVLPRDLRAILTGGGPVFPDVLERLGRSVRTTAVYGSTEAEPVAHLRSDEVSAEDRAAMDRGEGILAGFPVPQVSVRIVDDEILVAGDHVNRGYLDPSQDATTKVDIDGVRWHRTGDAGRLDGRGRLWLLGRHAGRVGGRYPFQVEAAARLWPGVRKAALVDVQGVATLALQGAARNADDWRRSGEALGVRTVAVDAIPMDPRHGSKVDVAALRTLLGRRGSPVAGPRPIP